MGFTLLDTGFIAYANDTLLKPELYTKIAKKFAHLIKEKIEKREARIEK